MTPDTSQSHPFAVVELAESGRVHWGRVRIGVHWVVIHEAELEHRRCCGDPPPVVIVPMLRVESIEVFTCEAELAEATKGMLKVTNERGPEVA